MAVGTEPQAPVDSYFDARTRYWNDIYASRDVQGIVYRRRMMAALQWAQELGPPAGTRALDIGCGAGLLTVELAAMGLSVIATDASQEMVRTATANVTRRGLQDRVEVRQADVHRLPFESDAFELVTLLGLLPWLHDAAGALMELGRVLAPGGTILVTADNERRLNRLVEPFESPLRPLLDPVRPLLRPAKRALIRVPDDAPPVAHAYRHLPGEVDEMLSAAGIAVVRRTTIGYGPFTVTRRRVVPDRLGRALDERLQGASRDHPRLRGVGWHYLAAGRKRALGADETKTDPAGAVSSAS